MQKLILAVGVSFFISLFLTPIMIQIAKKKNIVDTPNGRKEHDTPTPLLGGVAICIATVASILLFAEARTQYVIPVLFLGATGVSLMGMIDDIFYLSAKRRLVTLFILAVIVFLGFVQFYFYEYTSIMHDSMVLNILFSVFIILWIVGITNAINFSDGLDGLASYLSLVSVIAFAVVFALQGRDMLALPVTLALFGAIAGFTPYNRNPAMVFMGDAGSMFIGFMLGLLSITSISHEDTMLAVVVPVFILFVPILDMCVSILRRLLIGKPIMRPDKLHFHHVLNQRFKNHIFVAIILSVIQVGFAAVGILIFITKQYLLGWAIVGAVALLFGIYTVATALRYKAKTTIE